MVSTTVSENTWSVSCCVKVIWDGEFNIVWWTSRSSIAMKVNQLDVSTRIRRISNVPSTDRRRPWKVRLRNARFGEMRTTRLVPMQMKVETKAILLIAALVLVGIHLFESHRNGCRSFLSSSRNRVYISTSSANRFVNHSRRLSYISCKTKLLQWPEFIAQDDRNSTFE